MRLAISCSNRLFGEGLKNIVEEEKDIEVIGISDEGAGSFPQLDELIQKNPDILLAEQAIGLNFLLNSPKAKEVFKNRLKILLIGDRAARFLADRNLKELVSRGVLGILPPSADADLLKKALRAVFLGELWLDRATLLKLFSMMKSQKRNVGLAKREREIVSHICQGYRNKEIAEKLHISEQTVKSHCNRIYRKLGVSDRLQLALYSFGNWPEGISKRAL
jgi:DNA-binding NarL/FixJ family response regulator